jgi:hypothetical protein
MGEYDVNCAFSGVSLAWSEAVLVMLSREPGGVFRPVALPMVGDYHMYGAIGVASDRNTTLITECLIAATLAGRFVSTADDWPLTDREPSIGDVIEELTVNTGEWLGYRGGTEPTYASLVTFDEVPIVFTLIARPVWDTIVTTRRCDLDDPRATFDAVFGEQAMPNAIYVGGLDDLLPQLAELAAVDRFLAAGWDAVALSHRRDRRGWVRRTTFR